jgi:hypothetical protein
LESINECCVYNSMKQDDVTCVGSVAHTVRGTKELTYAESNTGILYKSYRTEFTFDSHTRTSDATGNLRKAQTLIN